MSVSGLTDYTQIMRPIVIIDDRADSRMLIARLLRDDHFSVSEIASHEDVSTLQADLVFLNISMPRGFEILAVLSTAHRRIVIYSSTGDSAALSHAMTSGATHSIASATAAELLAQVSFHAENSGILRNAPVASTDGQDLPPPFSLRISSPTGEITHWLVYERVRFFGEEMHVALACRYHLPFVPGETVRIDTRLGSTPATIGRITSLGTLVLLLHQSSRVTNLFEPSWD